MAAALEGASERQHMVVAENLSGHITPSAKCDCPPAASTLLRLGVRYSQAAMRSPPGGHHAPSGAHTGPGTSARVGPGRVPLGTLPVLCKPPAELDRSPALVATARPGHSVA
jgi:hypothetical protein